MSTPADQYRDAQVRAERVALEFGQQAPRQVQGETPLDYRIRLAGYVQEHSPDWKGQDLRRLAASSPGGFAVAEDAIYKDALHAAQNPSNAPGTPLTSRTRTDESGRRITTFSGDPVEAWKSFVGNGVRFLIGVGGKRNAGGRRA